MNYQKAGPLGSGWDEQVLELLACPACQGSLRLKAGDTRISCAGCGKKYPVEDGIPVLIVERALLPA
jgi:hypothetical protein